jgi:hypothetical protein
LKRYFIFPDKADDSSRAKAWLFGVQQAFTKSTPDVFLALMPLTARQAAPQVKEHAVTANVIAVVPD